MKTLKLRMAIAGLCSAAVLNATTASVGFAASRGPDRVVCNGVGENVLACNAPQRVISPVVCPAGSACITTLTSSGYTTPHPQTSTLLPLPTSYPVPGNWGTSQATIEYYLPANAAEIAEQQTGASLNGAMAIFQAQYIALAALSRDLHTYDTQPGTVGYYTAQFLAQVASKASANSLHILESAFGPTLITQALAYAPAATLQAYYAQTNYAPIIGSQYWISLGNTYTPAPIDTSPMDIYALQILSGAGELAATSQRKTVVYLQLRVKAGPVDIALALAGIAVGFYFWMNPDQGPALKAWLANNGPNWAPGVSPGDMPTIIQIPDTYPDPGAWPYNAPPDAAPEPFPTEGICYETDSGTVTC